MFQVESVGFIFNANGKAETYECPGAGTIGEDMGVLAKKVFEDTIEWLDDEYPNLDSVVKKVGMRVSIPAAS